MTKPLAKGELTIFVGHVMNLISKDRINSKVTDGLSRNGRSCLGKRNRAIDVRYFAIKDLIDRGDVEIKHVGTNFMVADYFTKCLQGEKFQRFRKLIWGM